MIDITRQVKIAVIQAWNKDITLPQAIDLIERFKGDIDLIRAYIPERKNKNVR